jgi:polyphosphate kinase
MDIEDDDGDKATLPRRPRGHKATASDMKKDVIALALSETFKGWMADKEEAIAVMEEKKRREKEATCNQFYDLTKKAIEVEESIAKAKVIEAEAKLMAEEREIMFVDTTNMSEGQKAWVEKHHAIILQCDA